MELPSDVMGKVVPSFVCGEMKSAGIQIQLLLPHGIQNGLNLSNWIAGGLGPNMRHREGSPIKCNGNKHAVFRVVGNQIRWYPSPAIASSWDAWWGQFVHMDCRHFKRGYNMRHRNGSSIKCIGENNAIYRLWKNERRRYPNAVIANSWDLKWREYMPLDCRKLKKGPDLVKKGEFNLRGYL